MMKRLLPVFAAAIMASCAGYFDAAGERDAGRGVQTLALADGSGYISTDNHNEITPYLYRDTNAGRAWLFFASDRDGNYDIYYAEMFPDGKFARPLKMGASINFISDDEYSPVVFVAYYNNYATNGIFITIGRNASGATNNITYLLNPDFSVNTEVMTLDSDNENHFALKNKLSTDPTMLSANGSMQWLEYFWDASSTGQWMINGNKTLSNIAEPVNSVDGYFQYIDGEDWVEWYLLGVQKNGKHQIYAGAVGSAEGQNYFPAPLYASSFNDKDPFLDETDRRVYFASDRYGKNNYDLYRYNLITYDTLKAPLLARPAPVLDVFTSPDPVQLSWPAVPGASAYRIFRYADPFMDDPYGVYTEVAETAATSYTDTDITDGFYYYMIQAIGSKGVSGTSTFIGGQYGTPPV